ncbi:hypothetical protein AN1V17_16120 [Vallitalea sediminicola]
MSDNKGRFISYSKDHINIVERGIKSIKEVLLSDALEEKLSVLFCLDRYYDSYYGNKLDFIDELTDVLQNQLFIEDNADVIDDIFSLLNYGRGNLDILANRIEEIDKNFLAEAIYTLGLDYNYDYEHIFIRFSKSDDKRVESESREALQNLEERRKADT